MKNIYHYLNTTEYLQEYFTYHKENNPDFSYANFAKEAGISSRGFLKLVIDGKRKISLKTLPKMVKGLKLNKAEAKYLATLIQFDLATDPQKKADIYSELLSFAGRIQFKPYEKGQHIVFNSWLHFAIAEIIIMKDCPRDIKNTPQWIAEKLDQKVDIKVIKGTIKDLLWVDLLKINDGYYEKSAKHIFSYLTTDNPVRQNFHRQYLDLSKNYLDLPVDEAIFGTATINIKSKDRPEVIEFLNNMMKDLIGNFCQHNEADEIYQTNIQFFPITKINQSEEE